MLEVLDVSDVMLLSCLLNSDALRLQGMPYNQSLPSRDVPPKAAYTMPFRIAVVEPRF